MSAQELITQHLDLWTNAVTTKSTAGRGTSSGKRGKIELTGIKKLRELILELAVRGKLVEQDPSDEPASVLLARIAEEKARLVKEGKIKKPKKLPEITEEEKPFELPEGWEWARLGNISQINPRNDAADDVIASFIPMPKITTSFNGEHEQEDRSWGEIKKGYTHFADGDIAIAKITPCFENSKAAVFRSLENGIGAGTTELHVARPYADTLNPLFILLCLKSPRFLSNGEKEMTGSAGQKRVPKDFFSGEPLPFPPLAEQNRIVEKVDELMALCDRLEQQVGDQLEAHEVLVDTLLDALTRSANAAEVAESWRRIAEHFDTLFTTEASIDKLKQAILQLAVMGRLVEQDPSDEPASVLLKRIAEEKGRLVKEGKIKQPRDLPVVTEDEKPFELPSGWAWARVGDVLSIKHGFAFKSLYFREKVTPYILTTPGNFHEEGGFRDRGDKTKYYDGQVESDFILREGELIIPMTEQAPGLLGSAAFVPKDGKKYLHNQRLGKLIVHSNLIEKDFVFWFFNCRILRHELARTCTGTTVRHTSPEKIRSVLFPVMGPKEQRRIVDKVDELMALCDQLKTRLAEAGETRNHLAEAVVKQAVTT